jgi:hypothetical protein
MKLCKAKYTEREYQKNPPEKVRESHLIPFKGASYYYDVKLTSNQDAKKSRFLTNFQA